VETGNAPFVSDRWLFSLNGYVGGFRGPFGEVLRRRVTEARAVGLEGTSDSEVLFALVLDAFDEGAGPEEALATVVATAAGEAESCLNLILGDGHSMWATTWGNSLFTLQGEGLAEGGVLVASEPLDDHPGWSPVPERSLVRASCTAVDVSPLSSHGGPR
jgi:glutamine amidotransferase